MRASACPQRAPAFGRRLRRLEAANPPLGLHSQVDEAHEKAAARKHKDQERKPQALLRHGFVVDELLRHIGDAILYICRTGAGIH